MELVSTKKRLSEHPDYYSAAATKACRTDVMVGDVLEGHTVLISGCDGRRCIAALPNERHSVLISEFE